MTAAQHEREPFARVPSRAGWVVGTARRPVGPNGRGLCRRCGAEVPTGRVTFCSGACVREWKIRTQPAFARRLVEERDRGVCAACGLDTEEARRWARRVSRRLCDFRGPLYGQHADTFAGYEWAKIPGLPRTSRSWWQADHILPVAEGGGDCGLENLRTLCSWCHAKASGELRRRLNARRRQGTGT